MSQSGERIRLKILLTLACGAVASLFWLVPGGEEPATPPPPGPEVIPDTTVQVSHDGEAVFRKAFWRRPGTDDRIVQAERLEWVDGAGDLVKWQWFLVVEPGPDLRDWVAGNPFNLTRPEALPGPGQEAGAYRPQWFPGRFESGLLFAGADGRQWIVLPGDGKFLYARDSGFGFSAEIPR